MIASVCMVEKQDRLVTQPKSAERFRQSIIDNKYLINKCTVKIMNIVGYIAILILRF